LVEQGAWLRRLGIGERAAALCAAHPERAEEIAGQLTRLTDASEMGRLFKVLALTGPDGPAPAGFGHRS
ncbi:MAG: class I SAM-dependent methyltransferase, partial [Alphaproteobacteria bacterium]